MRKYNHWQALRLLVLRLVVVVLTDYLLEMWYGKY